MEISFVILHYQNLDVTKKCIERLRKLENYNMCNIIIVDNASPNKSGVELKELYKNEENIHILCNKNNLGFANGNNIGYKYAKLEFCSDIIIVMNNDILIEQKDFIKLILNIAMDSKIQLVAPDIVNLQGVHQNPFRTKPLTMEKINKIYWYNRSLKYLYKIPILNRLIAKTLQNRTKHKKLINNHIEESLSNIVPHGSCIIYLKGWINKEDFAFSSETFMYLEEDILFEYIIKNNYKIKYTPELQVYHIEDASVDASTRTELKKRQFISKHLYNSVKILREMRLK